MCNRQHSTVAWASAFAGVDVLHAQADEFSLRIRLSMEGGIFLVYDAAIPPGAHASGRPGEEERKPGRRTLRDPAKTSQGGRPHPSQGARAHPAATARNHPGYLAYWNDFETQQLYVFGRLVFTEVDVGHALVNLNRDLGIDSTALATITWVLEEAFVEALAEEEDDTV